MEKQTRKITQAVVKPNIIINGEKHQIQKYQEEYKKLPDIKAVTCIKVGENSNDWAMAVLTIVGDKMEIDIGPTDVKMIIVDEAKEQFVKMFIDVI